MARSHPSQRHLWILLYLPIVLCAAATSVPRSSSAAELPAAETALIEALIGAVEKRTDVAFIRNGQAYGSTIAGAFLRRKWQAQASHIASTEDFIEKVASVSSTSGQPYLIRFGDGREIPFSVFLRAELAKLQRTPK